MPEISKSKTNLVLFFRWKYFDIYVAHTVPLATTMYPIPP